MCKLFKQVWLCLCLFLSISSVLMGQTVKHVVLISIDGLHPDVYLNSGWPAPHLQALKNGGVYADELLSVFPSFTYPSHTAMVTGALPARSKINFNQPVGNHGEWFWFADRIGTRTLWQALRDRNLSTAAVEWPVTAGADITWNIPEIWDIKHPDDHITVARRYATPGLITEIEQHVTGKLDSTNFSYDTYLLDENVGRAAAYIFAAKKPAFLAVHFTAMDDNEHKFGRDADSVRLALEAADQGIGDILEAVRVCGLRDSTAIIVVGDHGFSSISQVFRPNMLIKSLPAIFISSGGSAFLYPKQKLTKAEADRVVKVVTDSLNALPVTKRRLFHILDRRELDELGSDSTALMALSGLNGSGLVFSGAITAKTSQNRGPGTLIQNSKSPGLFIPAKGGHHGYDPRNREMYTGFIAYGAGIKKGSRIRQLSEPDVAVLIACLLGVQFDAPDGKLPEGVIGEP